MIRQALSSVKGKDSVLWSTQVGRMHSRNNILAREDRIFLSTSGDYWNAEDSADGITCVDSNSGSRIWFTPTQSDANELALFDKVILVGTDLGKIFALDSESGTIINEIRCEAAVYTRPIELQTVRGKIAILLSKIGELVQFDFGDNRFSILGNIPHTIRANPTAISAHSFIVGSEDGSIIVIEILDGSWNWKTLSQIDSHRASGKGNFELRVKGITSTIVVGDRVIVSYARNTYDRRPPITCFSLRTGAKEWEAGRIQSASKSEIHEFGNARVTPALWNGLLLSTFSYNESVHAFSLQSGKWIWRLRLDDSFFQNWSSPVVRGDQLYVARINGVVSVIDLNLRKLLSSYSVEMFDFADDKNNQVELSDEKAPWPNKLDSLESGPWPRQRLVAGICATPAVLTDRLLVGTVSGRLVCMRRSI
jgi:outer membrane protein assembly factor BamB